MLGSVRRTTAEKRALATTAIVVPAAVVQENWSFFKKAGLYNAHRFYKNDITKTVFSVALAGDLEKNKC